MQWCSVIPVIASDIWFASFNVSDAISRGKSRSHGIRKTGNCKRKKRAVKRSNTSLKDLSKVLEDPGRHSMLSFLSSLPISVLRILDTEANKFYDRNHQLYDAALLTRCYTQHALRPFIDSEIKRHFIKIPFIHKGIELIDLPSIFKDSSVTSSIPAYFQNSEPPIICYKYNKPIRNTVFNFNKLVSSHVVDFNARDKSLTAKLLQQGYRYHKLRKTFSKFYRRHYELVSKFNVGLKTLLHQGLSEPEFYGDLVYKFKKIVGRADFSGSVQKKYRSLQTYWI